MKKKILFAWDFHGVLEKDNEYAVLEFLNRTLSDFGIRRKISLKKVIEWYGLSWHDYFSNSYPEGNEKIWQAMHQNVLRLQAAEKIAQKHIKARENAKAVLKKIKNSGHQNIVISNSDQKFIGDCVRHIGLNKFIEKVIGMELHHLSRTKKVNEIKGLILKQYLNKKKFDKLVLIGDSISDILAGQAISAATYLFIGAKTFTDFHLKKLNPDYIISDLREVLKELK